MVMLVDAPVETVSPAIADELVVTVTLDDIREGRQGAPMRCAIALAVGRHLDPDTQWCQMGSIGFLHIFTNTPGNARATEVFVSEDASEWVRRFDRCKRDAAPERFVFRRSVD